MTLVEEFTVTILLSIGASLVVYFASYHLLHREALTRRFEELTRTISARWADYVFLALLSGYLLVFGTLSVLRHVSLHSGGVDLGVFDQPIWNSLYGRLMEVSIVPDTPNLLGQRFSPILIGFVPLYALWSDPLVLLIAQTFALGLGALPIYWFAREKIGCALALVIVWAYFASPAVENVNLYEFHEVALVAVFFAFGTFLLLRRHYKGFFICLALALLSKEEVAFTLVVFGIYIFLIQRRRLLGLALSSFGVAWGILVLQYVIPFFRGSEYGTGYYYFGYGAVSGGGRYEYLGKSLFDIAVTVLTRPNIVLQSLLVPEKLEYVLHFLIPLGFAPLIGLEVGALGIPTLAFSLLSTWSYQYQIRSYYSAPFVPIIFFAAVLGLWRGMCWADRGMVFLRARGDTNTERWARKFALGTLILVASTLSYYFQSPGPLARHFEPGQYAIDAHTMIGYDLMRLIPKNAAIISQREMAAHLTHRRRIYEFPFHLDYRQADYLFSDEKNCLSYCDQKDWDVWRAWAASGYFEVIARQDGYLLAKHKEPVHSARIQYGNQMTLLGFTVSAIDQTPKGRKLLLDVEWRAEQDIPNRYTFQLRLEDSQGHLWAQDEPESQAPPTYKWIKQQRVTDPHSIFLPPTMPPGNYTLSIAVYDPEAKRNLSARNALGIESADEIAVGAIFIEKDKVSKIASDLFIEQPLYVDMREIRFLGSIPHRRTISPGELLQIGVYWRARNKPQGDYVVAVQLRDVSGHVAFEQAMRPANGAYPTTAWDAGEVLLDWHDFHLPKDIATGQYEIFAVLRHADNGYVIGEVGFSTVSVVQ